MRGSRWPFFGLIVAGAVAAGSCTGALAGHYTVTGGLYHSGGWDMPSFGAERANAELPPAEAKARAAATPSYVGYYPDQASDIAEPTTAVQAARDYAALYDAPVQADPDTIDAIYRSADEVDPDWPAAPAGSAEAPAYWEADDGEAALD